MKVSETTKASAKLVKKHLQNHEYKLTTRPLKDKLNTESYYIMTSSIKKERVPEKKSNCQYPNCNKPSCEHNKVTLRGTLLKHDTRTVI